MGQSPHLIVNLDRKEYIAPYKFGDMGKVGEFDQSAGGMMTGLSMLLYGSAHDGGGYFRVAKITKKDEKPKIPKDWRIESSYWSDFAKRGHAIVLPKIVGRWAGDRIVIIGDYAIPGKYMKEFMPLTKEQWQKVFENSELIEECWKRKHVSLYGLARGLFKDVSEPTAKALKELGMLRSEEERGAMRPDILIVASGQEK